MISPNTVLSPKYDDGGYLLIQYDNFVYIYIYKYMYIHMYMNPFHWPDHLDIAGDSHS